MGWQASIVEARTRLDEELQESPSLGTYPDLVLDKRYEVARLKAASETDLALEVFPAACPYSVSEILDSGFYPGPA